LLNACCDKSKRPVFRITMVLMVSIVKANLEGKK
jgi:hypothetical protein